MQRLYKVIDPSVDGGFAFLVRSSTENKAKVLIAAYLSATLGGRVKEYKDRLLVEKVLGARSLNILLNTDKENVVLSSEQACHKNFSE